MAKFTPVEATGGGPPIPHDTQCKFRIVSCEENNDWNQFNCRIKFQFRQPGAAVATVVEWWHNFPWDGDRAFTLSVFAKSMEGFPIAEKYKSGELGPADFVNVHGSVHVKHRKKGDKVYLQCEDWKSANQQTTSEPEKAPLVAVAKDPTKVIKQSHKDGDDECPF